MREYILNPVALGVSKNSKIAIIQMWKGVPYSGGTVSTREMMEGSQFLVSAEVFVISDTEYRIEEHQ